MHLVLNAENKLKFMDLYMYIVTLCYAIVFPGRKSAFRAGFWLDCYREGTEIGPTADQRPAGGPIYSPEAPLGNLK